jgi:hypothetical protein
VQCLEHEAVAAERNDDFGVVRGNTRITLAQFVPGSLRGFGFGRDDGDPRR